jgi:hypothetical protein
MIRQRYLRALLYSANSDGYGRRVFDVHLFIGFTSAFFFLLFKTASIPELAPILFDDRQRLDYERRRGRGGGVVRGRIEEAVFMPRAEVSKTLNSGAEDENRHRRCGGGRLSPG